ncbi:hypothetical protein SDC9_152938 [bioreactor metagenome]|uniref:Uncharacterized protein n=1 Tax=bioreactor metagenome TaxID=1076179 RepID=A0A645EV16_9ZZZZ
MVLSPVFSFTFATCDNGIFAPASLVSIRFPIFSGVFRLSSLYRHIISYTLTPWKTCEIGFPPIAVSIRSDTSATFKPYCAILFRSAVIWSCGNGGSWSIARSAAPFTFLSVASTSSAILRVSLKSSPYIFTANSLCAPAILSITPSIMGWEKATLYPGIPSYSAASSLIKSAFVLPFFQSL